MKIATQRIALFLGLAAACASMQAQAGQLSATRLIFDAGSKDASISYTNTSNRCVGLYVWTADMPASEPSTAKSPIALLQPPKMVVGAGQSQSLRLRFVGNNESNNESLYWLSTHEVAVDESLCKRAASPPENGAMTAESGASLDQALKASLEIAIRTHIKVLVRPKGLQGNYPAVSENLQWSVESSVGKSYLVANNPTGYHMHFSSLELKSAGRAVRMAGRKGGMIAPMSRTRFELEQTASAAGKVAATLINDQGGSAAREWSL